MKKKTILEPKNKNSAKKMKTRKTQLTRRSWTEMYDRFASSR